MEDDVAPWDHPLEATLSALPSLYLVDLQGQRLGPTSANRFAEALKAAHDFGQLRITALHLADNRFGDVGAGEIAEAALLSSGDMCRDTDIRQEIASVGCLHLLDLSWNQIGPAGAASIASAMVHATRPLRALDLECNNVADTGTIALAAALPKAMSLIRLRLGGNRIGPIGAEALAPALARSQVTSLDLSRNCLGARGILALATTLRSSPKIQSLFLAVNRIGNEGVQALAATLCPTAQCGTRDECPAEAGLDILDLSANLIGDAGAVAIARALDSGLCALRCLELSYNRLTDKGVEALADVAEAGRNKKLQTIKLGGNDEVTQAAVNRATTSLRRNCRSMILYDPFQAMLESCAAGAYRVDLMGVHVGPDGASRLAEVLARPRVRVRELIIGNAGLGDAGATLLAPAVSRLPVRLEELDVSWNFISAEGIGAIAAAVLCRTLDPTPCGSSLMVLDLECNNLRDAGVAALMSPLERTSGDSLGEYSGHALRVLRLGGNCIGSDGAAHLARALIHPDVHLKELELGRNSLGPRGATALGPLLTHAGLSLCFLGLAVNRLLDAGAEALSAALKARAESNPEDDVHLDLAIGSNLIGDAGAEAVAAALAVGPALTGLCLEYNKVGSTGAEALAAAVRARCAKGWPRPIVRFTGV